MTNASAGRAWHSRPAALVFRAAALVAVATGIIRISGLLSGAPVWSAFLYYTVLSNLLCVAWLVLLIIRTVRELRRSGPHGTSTPSARISGAVTLAITVTMVIYLVVLLPAAFAQQSDYRPFDLTDTLIHLATPVLLIVDWALFVPKGRFRWYDPMLWAAVPYAYLLFAFSYAAGGGEFAPGMRYPYPFMNVEVLGIGGVVIWIIALTIGIEAIAFAYVAVDRLLGRGSSRAGCRP